MTPRELAALAKREAGALGFAACGVTGPETVPHTEALDSWLDLGMHGDMRYMERQAAARRDPGRVWAEARSIVVVLDNYYSGAGWDSGAYQVARYAQANDYHQVTRERLERLGVALTAAAGTGSFRSYVDAGPMPERELAQRAGLGWIGKNTMLIRPGLGSFTFIGVLLTDLDLERDAPFEADRCGSCTRCLDACPTDAFPAERVLDARLCISYLTIEASGEMPEALQPAVGDHLFGCDVCQDVCPWNVRFAGGARDPRFEPSPSESWPSLEQILEMDQRAFDARFGPTAIERARLSGIQRNARVVLRNQSATSASSAAPPAR